MVFHCETREYRGAESQGEERGAAERGCIHTYPVGFDLQEIQGHIFSEALLVASDDEQLQMARGPAVVLGEKCE